MISEAFKMEPVTLTTITVLAALGVGFGAGWGLGGFCPGPGVVSAVALGTEALVFVGTMLGGMVIFQLLDRQS